MSLLAVHIIVSIMSFGAIIALLFKSWVGKKNLNKSKLTIVSIMTFASVSSGLILVLQGAAITKACIEAGSLLALNVALLIYSRRLSLAEVTI